MRLPNCSDYAQKPQHVRRMQTAYVKWSPIAPESMQNNKASRTLILCSSLYALSGGSTAK